MAKEESLPSSSEERVVAETRPARPRRDVAPGPAAALPAQQAVAKHFVVAPDKTLSTLRGRIAAGKHVSAADFAGGEEAFAEIVRAGFAVEGAAPRARKARST